MCKGPGVGKCMEKQKRKLVCVAGAWKAMRVWLKLRLDQSQGPDLLPQHSPGPEPPAPYPHRGVSINIGRREILATCFAPKASCVCHLRGHLNISSEPCKITQGQKNNCKKWPLVTDGWSHRKSAGTPGFQTSRKGLL